MKIDCSKTLNYVNERNRMCDIYENGCEGCPLEGRGHCGVVKAITQEEINLVQKWSDEHPRNTMLEKFKTLFPKARYGSLNVPIVCVLDIGWTDKCIEDCDNCWNKLYIEREEK